MSKKPTTKKTAARKPAARSKKPKVDSWKRADGRSFDELRPLKIESGVLPNADGSAYIEMGRNKILCGVFGPREMHPKHNAKPNEAVLRCRYHMAPFSVDPRRSPAPSRRDQEISMVMRSALEPAVFLDRYPRASIDVYIEVLEADGGTRCASINAASVALVDAGIPMKDLVAACAVGKIDDKIIVDLGDYEVALQNGRVRQPVLRINDAALPAAQGRQFLHFLAMIEDVDERRNRLADRTGNGI